MNVVAGTPSEPSADFGMFVSSVVIDDEMDVEVVRHTAVDLTQESEELLMTVSRFTAGDDSPGGHIESREQSGRAVTFVIMGDAFDVAEAPWGERAEFAEELEPGSSHRPRAPRRGPGD